MRRLYKFIRGISQFIHELANGLIGFEFWIALDQHLDFGKGFESAEALSAEASDLSFTAHPEVRRGEHRIDLFFMFEVRFS